MYSMDDIMQASLGEESGKIREVFRKTVLIRQYETESVEAEVSLDLNRPITGIERMVLGSLLMSQAEYQVYMQLATRGIVTQTELTKIKKELEEAINLLDAKSVELTGKNLDYIIKGSVDTGDKQ